MTEEKSIAIPAHGFAGLSNSGGDVPAFKSVINNPKENGKAFDKPDCRQAGQMAKLKNGIKFISKQPW